ncbi:MAG: XdhC family protein [Gemmatimonadaceae bacterium]|nr:XdhC family protein [Gemmatimonadaceae bacterium]
MSHAELVTLLQAARMARRDRPDVPLALATLVAVEGSSYRQPGARVLCDAAQRVLAGAISGGCLEGDVAEHAAAVCASGTAQLLRYDLREDLETIWGFGTGCDGVAHVLLAPLADLAPLEAAVAAANARSRGLLLHHLDGPTAGTVQFVSAHAASDDPRLHAVRDIVHRTAAAWLDDTVPRHFATPVLPPPHLVIVGASRGAEAMARIAHSAGVAVTVVDHREHVLESLHLPQPVQRQTVTPDAAGTALAAGLLPTDARTAFALCTHKYEHDAAWLRAALTTETPYIGLLGSRQRAARLLDTVGVHATPDATRVYAPIGLDIGAESPEEIALATVAEVQAVLNTRTGGPLRERRMPLHTRSATPSLPSVPTDAACSIERAGD